MNFSYMLSSQNNWPSLASVGQFFYILLLVVFVVLLAYYSTRLMASARSGRKRGGRHNLEIIEGVGVGAQATAQIVRAGSRYFLVGVTKERVTLLAELDEAHIRLSDAGGLSLDSSFDRLLQRFTHRDKNAADDARDEAGND